MRLARFAWSRADWLPTLTDIRWPTLERCRGEHEVAVERYEQARGGDDETAATVALLDTVEKCARDLFATIDLDGPGGWSRSYKEQRATLIDLDHELRTVPVGGEHFEQWRAKAAGRGQDDLIAAAELRLRLREDAERIAAMRNSVLRRDEYLRNGSILRACEAEVAAVRETLAPEPETAA